jgi:hypothetical protein
VVATVDLQDVEKSLVIQGAPGGKGGHTIRHSKRKKKCICTCVLFQTVSAIELFHLKI